MLTITVSLILTLFKQFLICVASVSALNPDVNGLTVPESYVKIRLFEYTKMKESNYIFSKQ